MYNENAILIMAVANGYKVILPFQRKRVPMLSPRDRAIIKHQVQVAKEEWAKDDILSKLQEEPATNADDSEEQVSLEISDQEYFFQTFQEVLDFLKFKINPVAVKRNDSDPGDGYALAQ